MVGTRSSNRTFACVSKPDYGHCNILTTGKQFLVPLVEGYVLILHTECGAHIVTVLGMRDGT